MPLTKEQNDKLNNWMKSHSSHSSCPLCDGTKWSPGDIISSPIFTKGGVAIGGPSVLMVQLVCKSCAYVMLLAAGPVLGLKD